MRVPADHDEKRIQAIWKKTVFAEVDELGFYHFIIPATDTKYIDFAIEPSLAPIYKTLIREMEKMHKVKRRQSFVETDNYLTPFTSISDATKAIDNKIENLDKLGKTFKASKADKPTA